jgi:PKD repeat protein
MWKTGQLIIGAVAVGVMAGCTVQETEAPAFAGPSELALSLQLQAIPDSILQDGASQSAISITARGPDSQPVRGLSLRVEMLVEGVPADFGTLSSKTVVTGDDGVARLTYTAPPRPVESVGTGTIVTLVVTPMGSDYRGQFARQVDLRLVPPGVILPPPGELVPAFNFSPTTVQIRQIVNFDASATTSGGTPCGAACTYTWTFGDGGSGSGQTTTHEFRAPGTYVVTLRVTTQRGQAATLSQNINVAAGTPPTAAFVFSPQQPAIAQDIFFNAEASRAAAGRRIISYDWDFGSGRTANGVTTVKGYNTAGVYNVTLTVTDDANQTGTTTQAVTVGAAGTGLVANLTFSPTAPSTSTQVFFDASASRGPSPITEYRFTFGDGSQDVVGASPTTLKSFAVAGAYVVRVTVRDSQSRTATTTVTVTVTP